MLFESKRSGPAAALRRSLEPKTKSTLVPTFFSLLQISISPELKPLWLSLTFMAFSGIGSVPESGSHLNGVDLVIQSKEFFQPSYPPQPPWVRDRVGRID
jgi:hypothetical protein